MTEIGKREILESLSSVAKVLQEESEPAEALQTLCRIAEDLLDADGAKVVVVQRGQRRPKVSQLSRTDLNPSRPFKTVDLSEERGLADWVITRDDWVLVPEIADEDRQELRLKAVTGEHGEVVIRPREEKELVDARGDEENTLLMVPLSTSGRSAGALGVWRDRREPFEAGSDPDKLRQIAPYVAGMCRQVLQQRTFSAELAAISNLAAELQSARSLERAYGAVAEGVGQLAMARHAILLHHDPDLPGNLYQRFTWSADPEGSESLRTLFQGLYISTGEDPRTWRKSVREAVVAQLDKDEQAKEALYPYRLLGPLPSATQELPKLAVVLLDNKMSGSRSEFFADELLDHAAFSFLQFAGPMLTSHIGIYPRRVLEEIGDKHEGSEGHLESVLETAAEILKDATSASGALVYTGPRDKMTVTRASPKHKELMGLDVTKPSVTWDSIRLPEIRRVVDTGDSKEQLFDSLDSERLDEIRKAFGWERLRSWLSCPVVHHNRCVGVIKLLTADRDSFLGKDHEEVAKAVAERAGFEIEKLNRRLMLEELNVMADSLTQEAGESLGSQLIQSLEKWASRFVRPGTGVAVISRLLPDRPLINRSSRGVQTGLYHDLVALSKYWGEKRQAWNQRTSFDLERKKGKRIQILRAGVAVPIKLPQKAYLQGHLVMLHKDGFGPSEEDAVAEAAREVGIILNVERLRRQWVEGVGRFRHAVLGPVQGLASRAGALAALVGQERGYDDPIDDYSSATIGELRDQIEEEAEVVRLWRHNQKLYLDDKVEVVIRPQSLKRVFDRCIERYKPILRGRKVKLKADWKSKGELLFRFDDKGLDLALSNLLDNARKYAFSNTVVTLGAESSKEWIRIWVEDTGHKVPHHVAIYAKSQRMDWQDPFRTIGGEGLGLPMVKAIVDAHEGNLTHSSELLTSDASSPTARHLVRFTIELPSYWRR